MHRLGEGRDWVAAMFVAVVGARLVQLGRSIHRIDHQIAEIHDELAAPRRERPDETLERRLAAVEERFDAEMAVVSRTVDMVWQRCKSGPPK